MISFLFAIGLSIIHLVAGKLRFLEGIPRSRWLSLAGGTSVAYVFIRLLPELSARQQDFASAIGNTLGFLENHIYLLAMLGLISFYGLERMVKSSQERHGGVERGKRASQSPYSEPPTTSQNVFWLHMASFALYNALIGYLLDESLAQQRYSLIFFATAMGFHFIVVDFGLRTDYKALYHRFGRWVLAVALLAGWGIGRFKSISDLVVSILVSFLAGGIILNVLKEELPKERQSRFWPFLVGAVLYAVLLIIT
jgi:hypothetical protein